MSNLSTKQKLLIMSGLMFGILLAAIDGTIVATAMPTIAKELDGFSYYTWPMTAFLLTLTISMPIFGKLADLYGFKSTYIMGILVFLIGSILCGISQNMVELIIFRGIQGIGGAILSSNSLAIIGVLFPPVRRAKYIGIAGSAAGLGSIIGPILGGLFTDHLSWRWIFYINIPFGIIALILIILALPSYKPDHQRNKVDIIGAIFLIGALFSLLLALSWGGSEYEWSSLQIIGLFVSSLVLLIAFIFIELKVKDPIIPMNLYTNSVFTLSSIIMFLVAAVMMGVSIFIPLFVQSVIGKSASQSGIILMPLMVSMIVAAIVSGSIISKTAHYKLLTMLGFLITGVSLVLLSGMTTDTTNSTVVLYMIVTGIGFGIVMPVSNVTAQSIADEKQMGTVTSSVQLFKYLGQTIAGSVLGAVLSSYLSSNNGNMITIMADAIHRNFIICLFLIGASIVVGMFMKADTLIKE